MGELHNVAVYGTLMKGERNDVWRHGVETVGEGTACGTLYDTGFGYPAFVPGAGGVKVAVEVLSANDRQLARMDALEGYPNLYRREDVDVTMGDGSVVKAIVYVMNRLPAHAKVILEDGDGVADWRAHARGSMRGGL